MCVKIWTIRFKKGEIIMENKTIEGKEITKGFFIPEDEIADNYVEYK